MTKKKMYNYIMLQAGIYKVYDYERKFQGFVNNLSIEKLSSENERKMTQEKELIEELLDNKRLKVSCSRISDC